MYTLILPVFDQHNTLHSLRSMHVPDTTPYMEDIRIAHKLFLRLLNDPQYHTTAYDSEFNEYITVIVGNDIAYDADGNILHVLKVYPVNTGKGFNAGFTVRLDDIREYYNHMESIIYNDDEDAGYDDDTWL